MYKHILLRGKNKHHRFISAGVNVVIAEPYFQSIKKKIPVQDLVLVRYVTVQSIFVFVV